MTDYDFNTNQFGGNDYKSKDILIKLYYEKELSLVDTAEVLGTSKYMVRKWMQKHGLDRRESWEHFKQNFAGYTHNPNGYAYWYSNYRREQKNMKVHRLLAISEYGFDAVVKKHVHHKNSIPWDNRPDNIEILEPSTHIKSHSKGESNCNATLTQSEVKEIKKKLQSDNIKQTELAKQYGVQRAAITKIKTERKWTHIDP